MFVSEVTRSIAVGDDLAPLMEDCNRENERWHRSQHRVLLYGVSHLRASLEANLL